MSTNIIFAQKNTCSEANVNRDCCYPIVRVLHVPIHIPFLKKHCQFVVVFVFCFKTLPLWVGLWWSQWRINRAVHTILSEILLTHIIVWEFAVWLVQNTWSSCVLVTNLSVKRGTTMSHARSGRASWAFYVVGSCSFWVKHKPAKKKMKPNQFSFSWTPTFAHWLWVLVTCL